MDLYLLRFERYATAQRWKRDKLATKLSSLLKGKALDVYALMPVEQALDYDMLNMFLKRLSFGRKERTKELKLECANYLGQTS